ncbi:MAG: flagellar secretion chaperone FliS [Desulfovibrionales bacterium]|jgi:flagellar protein FliS|nr:flagellar secretion chaperone FliS [Desulfovibrionales bacterium]
MQTAAHAYLATQVNTTSQGQLLIMLYDAAIKFLKQAKVYIEKRDYAQKGILISKALEIVGELSKSLNRNQGGELSANLLHLYFYCQSKLLKANLKMDIDLIDEVIAILAGLRSAFAEIVPEYEGKAPAPQAAAQPKLRTAPAPQPMATLQMQENQAASMIAPSRPAAPGLKVAGKTIAGPTGRYGAGASAKATAAVSSTPRNKAQQNPVSSPKDQGKPAAMDAYSRQSPQHADAHPKQATRAEARHPQKDAPSDREQAPMTPTSPPDAEKASSPLSPTLRRAANAYMNAR